MLLSSLLLSGCLTTAIPGSDVEPPVASAPTEAPASPEPTVSVETEARNNRLTRLAQEQHPKILQTYGGEYSDPKLERMVAKVVGNLTTVSDNPSQVYRITILNSPQVNAFALPGGYLYVTRGLLALANDSAELGAVIAHEMGHVTANHGIQRLKMEQDAQIVDKVVDNVLGPSSDAEIIRLKGKMAMAQFSRNQELEADAIGIRSNGQAGLDPFAAARFLKAMAEYANLRSVSGAQDASLDFLASHPNTPQRIDLAQRHARQFGAPGIGERDRDSYLAGLDGLLFGDTPDEGYVRGTAFMHPKLGVAFSVPKGFVIDNSSTAVTAAGPNNSAIRFDGVALDRSTSLETYLASGWVQGLVPGSIRATTINGSEAATASAQAEGWKFDVTVIRAGGQVYRLLTATPANDPSLDGIAGFVRSSFHILTPAEKAALKPLRIRIVPVRSSDTIASMAARMVGVDSKEALFRVLNGLEPGDALPAGQNVKIVSE